MDNKNHENSHPTLTVIMTCYNREDVVGNGINSLLNQDAGHGENSGEKDRYQVIVVDNNSTDRTAEIAREMLKGAQGVEFIEEKKQGLSHARNAGLDRARGEFVAFIDEDAIAPPNWVSRLLEIIEKENPDIIAGPIYPYYTADKPEWFDDKYEIRMHHKNPGWVDTSNRENWGEISGSNFCMRKKLLEELGRFDPELGMSGGKLAYAEEVDLYFRALSGGASAYYDHDLKITHHVPDFKKHISYYLYRSYKAGKNGVQLFGRELPEKLITEQIEEIMEDFNQAFKHRDTGKYPHPDNYLLENTASKFAELGLLVEQLDTSKKAGFRDYLRGVARLTKNFLKSKGSR